MSALREGGQTITTVLGDAALKGLLLVGFASALHFLLRRQPASVRHALWAAALLAQLALPILSLVLPSAVTESPVLTAYPWLLRPAASDPTESSKVQESTGGAPIRDKQSLGGAADAASEHLAESATQVGVVVDDRKAPPLWPVLLAALWLAGAMAALARLMIGTVQVWRETVRASATSDGRWVALCREIADEMHVGRRTTLLCEGRFGVPFTWGVVSPVICVPQGAETWSEQRLRLVLVHEMAHVKRMDALTEILAQIVTSVFWFSPATWLAVRRLRAERERACDDAVLRSGVPAHTYVTELVDMLRHLYHSATPAFGSIAMARPTEFEGRVLAILNPRVQRADVRRATRLAAAALILLLTFPLASLRRARESTSDGSGKTESSLLADGGLPDISATLDTLSSSALDTLLNDCRAHAGAGVAFCEVRRHELTIGPLFTIDAGKNDRVRIVGGRANERGWIRAVIRGKAPTLKEATQLARAVSVNATASTLRSGQTIDTLGRQALVFYEIVVPRQRKIAISAVSGEILLHGFAGFARVRTINGPLTIERSGGTIIGETRNGPLYVTLAGTRWAGAELRLESANGPVYLTVPARYNADLETGTTYGPSESAVALQSTESKDDGGHQVRRHFARLGIGGAPVRVVTLNGPSSVRLSP